MARMYIDRYGEIVDWANMEGKTALHVAASKGNEELVRVSVTSVASLEYQYSGSTQMLCDFEADFDLADNEGNTPLH